MSQHPTLTDKELLDMLPTIQLKDEAPRPQVWLTRKDAFAFARSAYTRGVAAGQAEIERLERERDYSHDVNDVYKSRIDELEAKLKALEEQEPVAWVRRHPDGALTNEFLEDAVIEPVRKKSGAWVQLYLAAGAKP